MHHSDAISFPNCASDSPCFCAHGVWKLFFDVRGPFRTKSPRYENCSYFWEKFSCFVFLFVLFGGGVEQFRFRGRTILKISLKYVSIYRKYTESEYDIQNNHLLYKIIHKCQKVFEHLFLGNSSKSSKVSFFFIL